MSDDLNPYKTPAPVSDKPSKTNSDMRITDFQELQKLIPLINLIIIKKKMRAIDSHKQDTLPKAIHVSVEEGKDFPFPTIYLKGQDMRHAGEVMAFFKQMGIELMSNANYPNYKAFEITSVDLNHSDFAAPERSNEKMQAVLDYVEKLGTLKANTDDPAHLKDLTHNIAKWRKQCEQLRLYLENPTNAAINDHFSESPVINDVGYLMTNNVMTSDDAVFAATKRFIAGPLMLDRDNNMSNLLDGFHVMLYDQAKQRHQQTKKEPPKGCLAAPFIMAKNATKKVGGYFGGRGGETTH